MERRLRTLLYRVEHAKGPDRDLDYDVLKTLFDISGFDRSATDPDVCRPAPYWKEAIPKISSSIDAAVELLGCLRPGWHILLATAPNGALCNIGSRGTINPADDLWLPQGVAATPPLALLAAILRSMISGEAIAANVTLQ